MIKNSLQFKEVSTSQYQIGDFFSDNIVICIKADSRSEALDQLRELMEEIEKVYG